MKFDNEKERESVALSFYLSVLKFHLKPFKLYFENTFVEFQCFSEIVVIQYEARKNSAKKDWKNRENENQKTETK